MVPAQFTQVASGRVPPGGSVEIEVNLDEVAIASFALFDPSRSLGVTIRGASGNVIALNARDHGLIQVDDPATLVHLGYGFDKPRPGPWKVTLQAQPGLGADYALSARVAGGAQLRAQASELTPAVGQPVALSATLELAGRTLTDVAMEAVVHAPNGRRERLELVGSTMPLAGGVAPAGVRSVRRGRDREGPRRGSAHRAHGVSRGRGALDARRGSAARAPERRLPPACAFARAGAAVRSTGTGAASR